MTPNARMWVVESQKCAGEFFFVAPKTKNYFFKRDWASRFMINLSHMRAKLEEFEEIADRARHEENKKIRENLKHVKIKIKLTLDTQSAGRAALAMLRTNRGANIWSPELRNVAWFLDYCLCHSTLKLFLPFVFIFMQISFEFVYKVLCLFISDHKLRMIRPHFVNIFDSLFAMPLWLAAQIARPRSSLCCQLILNIVDWNFSANTLRFFCETRKCRQHKDQLVCLFHHQFIV